MITAEELQPFPLFASLSEEWRQKIAATAGELLVSEGEWIIREGESPAFYVLLSGAVNCEKDFGGATRILCTSRAGDFHGEIPILLDSAAIASLKAIEPSRLLSLDRTQFKDMIACSQACSELVMEIMKTRLRRIHDHMQANDPIRVRVVGSLHNSECREIRDFLSQNHVAYRWSHHDQSVSETFSKPFVVVDKVQVLTSPLSVRGVANALGINTVPTRANYDLVIIGAGPAGLAAAVSASSEGLRVLLIEKQGIGGQAACSSRIENYPGFPTGICGNELASKTLRQAVHFGAEIVMTREVENITTVAMGYKVQMDGNDHVFARAILIATGVQWKKLNIPGLGPLLGRGVLYGAARPEAHTVIGKEVFIVGAGNSAGQAAMFFSSYAANVTILARRADVRGSMSQYLVDQLNGKANIHIETCTALTSAWGESQLQAICTVSHGKVMHREADALFVMIGACAASSWMPSELQRNPEGFVFTGRDVIRHSGMREPYSLETSLDGVFCAGDIRHESIKRVSSAMGEGSMVTALLHQYLALQPELEATLV